jgi:DNA polymerase-3 subunit delta
VAEADRATALFWGEDGFLLREAALAFLQERDVRTTEVDGRMWQGGETSDLATPSLWGDRRALFVSGCQGLPQDGLQELLAYIQAPSPDSVCVLTLVSGGRNAPPLAKAVDAAGGLVRQIALRRQELTAWILDRAKARTAALSSLGATALVETIGEDPAALDQAVEQLAGAFSGVAIGPAEVRSQFQGLGERRVWDLCDQAFAGRLGPALVVLRSLLAEREDPLAILGGVAARVRDLIRVRALPPRMPAGEAARAAGLRFDWQLRRYREQAGRFSEEGLADLHARVVEADRALKGGVAGDVLLPTLVAAMAGRPEAALTVEIRTSR